MDSCKEDENDQPQVIAPHITSISPAGGAINAVITIRGIGFGANAAAATVSFNGTIGEVISNDGQTLTIKVPQGATSGPVTVSVGDNTSNGVAFEVGKEVMSAGGADFDSGFSVAVNADGSKYVAGAFSSEATFGNTTLSASSEDGFLAKYSPEGEIMWVKHLTGTYNERVIAIAVDESNNVYLTGYVSSTNVTLGSLTTSANSMDGFVARVNADGTPLWLETFVSDDTDIALALALDATGNVVITGAIGSQVTIGNTTLSVAGNEDVLVAAYNKDSGEPMWAKVFGGPDADAARAIVVSGNAIYVGGNFFQQFDVPGSATQFSAVGELDGFLLKLDLTGAVQWVKQIGGPNWDAVVALTMDRNGDCIAGGYFTNSLTTGASLSSNGAEDIFLMKLGAASGQVAWSKGAGSINNDEIASLAVDDQNNIYATGKIEGAAHFDDIAAGVSGAASDVFAAKYSTAGKAEFVRTAGAAESDFGTGIAVDSNGVIYVTGSYRKFSVTFGATQAPNAGSDDIFLWKIWQ